MKALIATLLLCGAAHGQDFTHADWARQAAITGLLAVDYGQTSYALQTEGFRELNQLVPKSPAGARKYFAASMALSAGVSRALPAQYRRYFQYGLIATQTAVVIHNHRQGTGFAYDDKDKHALISGLVGAATGDWRLAMLPGVAKELYDSRSGGSGWSNRDMVANAIGAGLGIAVHRNAKVRIRRNGITISGEFK